MSKKCRCVFRRLGKCQTNVRAFSGFSENVKKCPRPASPVEDIDTPEGHICQWRLSAGVLACQIGQREIIHWRHRWSDQPVEDHALLHMRIRSASGTLSFGALQCQIHQWKIIQWRPSESAPPVEDYSLTPLKVRSAIGGLPSGALEIQIRQ